MASWLLLCSAGTVLVKLGGSAVTRKSQFETLNAERLNATAASLARARSDVQGNTVLVHGAGSFGHFQASQHGVSRGTSDTRFSWLGFCATRSSVTRLNAAVVEALARNGLPAIGLSPFPRWRTRNGQPLARCTRACVSEVRELLERGFTPVLHGDACLDEKRGSAILSGDAIMVALCASSSLKPERAVFLTDVAGVFSHPPDEPGARLLPRLLVNARGALVGSADGGGGARGRKGERSGVPSMSVAAHDVTGGIAGKLDAAFAIAAAGVPVTIVEAGTPHAEAALRGETPQRCTVIELDSGAMAAQPAQPPAGKGERRTWGEWGSGLLGRVSKSIVG